MKNLHLLSAEQAAAAVASKEISSVELVKACLEHIDTREGTVGAWAFIDPEYALREARARDAEPVRGPLHGVPVGIKDIIDTKDLPTEYGSKIYQGHRPQRDAACVSLVRRAGGIILGKTVTTEFALYQPGKTANPHNSMRTPGGSSSGSAAAVADFHVPVAFGSQTSGSVIRPSAFCGVVGYKPSFNTFAPDGIKPLAASLDTLGLIARTVSDLSLLWAVLQGEKSRVEQPVPVRPRIGLCRTPFWEAAGGEQRAALVRSGQKLADNGLDVVEIVLPGWFDTLNELHAQLMAYELARNFVYENDVSRRGMLSARTRQVIEEGWRVSPDDYLAARATVRRARAEFLAACDGLDAVMVPAAPGEAPVAASTGDPVFNRMWTLLGVPAITLPVAVGPKGLPLGVQFVGRVDSDLALLELCRHIQAIFGEPFVCL